ncbi:MAG TPA: ureidoglycolate lyase [Myxococcota bacterium]|nr:ureidoglycolate lyase [Myxococcota bacterium]
MRTLQVRPLTTPAFEPFGAVIEARDSAWFPINQGTTRRYHRLATVELSGPEDEAQINIFRGQAFGLPLVLRQMERHPLGSQAFMPLERRPYLVVVAPPGPTLDEAEVRAFLARGDQGVQYARDCWHHPLLALGETSDFLVVDRGGPGDNCVEVELADPIQLLGLPGPLSLEGR